MTVFRAIKGIVIAFVIAMIIVVGLTWLTGSSDSGPRQSFCGGSGTSDDPWLICSAEALRKMSTDPALFADFFLVTEDIDLAEQIFDPIGDEEHPFAGTFEGDGHTIEHLVIRRSDDEFVGLFGWVAPEGHVRGIDLERADVRGEISVGSLVGYNEGIVEDIGLAGIVEGESAVGGVVGQSDGPIRDVESSAVVSGQQLVGGVVGITRADIRDNTFWGSVIGRRAVGGVVGAQMAGSIINSGVTGDNQEDFFVEGEHTVGGLVGSQASEDGDVTIKDSFAAINVRGTEEAVGGLAGLSTGPVTGSHATGDVEGGSAAGGLIGVADGPVSTSWATGDVTGDVGVGGLIGSNGAPLSDVYAEGDVSGNRDVGGLVGRNEDHISTAYAFGFSDGEHHVGGLVGHNLGQISQAFWNEDTGLDTTDGNGTALPAGAFSEVDHFSEFRFCPGDDCRWTMSEPLQRPVLKTAAQRGGE